MKKLIMFVGLFAVALFAVVFLLYASAATIVGAKAKGCLESMTGLQVNLEGIKTQRTSGPGVMPLSVHIRKISVQSPEGFRSRTLCLIENTEMAVDLLPILMRQWKIRKLSATLSQINVEQSAAGAINLAKMPVLSDMSLKKTAATKSTSSFLVERVEFTFGTLNFYDFKVSPESEPEVMDFQNKVEVYDKVNDSSVLIQAPALTVIYRLNKGSLGIPRGKVQENISRHVGKPA